RTFRELLQPHYAQRKVKNAAVNTSMMKTDNRVSWSNHLSSEATLIRMEEERRLRMGDEPTRRLTKEFRERFEDTLWPMVNSPEFVMVPWETQHDDPPRSTETQRRRNGNGSAARRHNAATQGQSRRLYLPLAGRRRRPHGYVRSQGPRRRQEDSRLL